MKIPPTLRPLDCLNPEALKKALSSPYFPDRPAGRIQQIHGSEQEGQWRTEVPPQREVLSSADHQLRKLNIL